MNRRRRSSLPRKQQGFLLIALLALLAMGGVYFLVSNLTPEAIEARRQAKTAAVLAEAREALIGYALTYRDRQAAQDPNSTDDDDSAMYGYLPMPDMGETFSRNSDLASSPCVGEGCATLNQNQINQSLTYIGRFPWKTVGTAPLRDGAGECLWYIVSASHREPKQDLSKPMNWDTLGQIDVVTTTDTEKMRSLIMSAHDRPLAIIFSPGDSIGDQNRGSIGSDDVTECGGNYSPANYLEPNLASALLDSSGNPTIASAYFTGSILSNPATTNLAIATQGRIVKEGATALKATCTSGAADCVIVANDTGLPITSRSIFDTLSKRQAFIDEINGLLKSIETGLASDSLQGTLPAPVDTGAFSQPPDTWTLGRIPDSGKYGDANIPLGYFSNFRDQIFYAKCNNSNACLTAAIGSEEDRGCAAVMVFAGQRGPSQTRASAADRNTLANYLEGDNRTSLSAFTTRFVGQYDFKKDQSVGQDIVRCIPDAANAGPFAKVDSPNLPTDKQLVNFDAATMTLTLGSSATTGTGYAAADLFGCAWDNSEAVDFGSGLRAYFRFKIPNTGDGFVFALPDGDRNFGTTALPSLPCGMSGQHLGYSGDNGLTPYINYPKIGFEFDTSRNSNYSSFSNILISGRNDPCYTSGCGGQGLSGNGHVGIVYWGYETTNASNPTVSVPRGTDNIHGFPLSDNPVDRPAPQNPPALLPYPSLSPPDPPPGVAPFPSLTGGTAADRDFHARIEITRSYRAAGDAKDRKSTYNLQMWILQESITVANQIAAMKNVTRPMSQLYPTFNAKISDRPTMHDIAVGACDAGGLCTGPERLKRSACAADKSCPATQSCGADNYCYVRLNTCGSDNVCYQEALHSVRPGFTIGQRTNDQQIEIMDFVTSWQP